LEEFKRDGNAEFWQQVKEVRAELTESQLASIKDYATKMFSRTHCQDFARMDFRMDSQGQIKLLDVNPNCWLGGKYRLMASWAGYGWPQILARIVATAQQRHLLCKKKKEAKKDFEQKRTEEHLKKLGLTDQKLGAERPLV